MFMLRTLAVSAARTACSRPTRGARLLLANARLLSDVKQKAPFSLEQVVDFSQTGDSHDNASKDLATEALVSGKKSSVVQSIPELESILSEVAFHGDRFHGGLAASVISRVAAHVASDASIDSGLVLHELQSDFRFEMALVRLQSNAVDRCPVGALLAAVKALKTLGLPSDHLATRNMLNSLLWRARSSTMQELCNMLSFCAAQKVVSAERNRLLVEVCDAFERRWVEVVEPATFVAILHYTDIFSEGFLNKIEDRLTELAGSIAHADMVMILSKLGEKKRRPRPLLKALSFHLSRCRESFTIKELSDCLFALKQLSYKQQDLLEALCRKCDLNDVESVSVVRSILTSVGQLKYLNEPLMDDLGTWLSARVASLSTRDLVTFLLTTATLNYKPKTATAVFQRILSDLSPESIGQSAAPTQSSFEHLWLDVVWSLAVLDMHTSKHLTSILAADFYNTLLHVHDSRNVGLILKVLNLNAVAKFFTPDYQGPTINVNEDPLLREAKALDRNDRVALVSSVVESFSTLVSPPLFLATHVNSLMGFQLDAECVVSTKNGKLNPLPLELHGHGANAKALPSETHRVALLVTSFSDVLINGSPSGLNVLCKRLLGAAGYKVLEVTHLEFSASMKKVDRVKLLEKKLKSLLQPEH